MHHNMGFEIWCSILIISIVFFFYIITSTLFSYTYSTSHFLFISLFSSHFFKKKAKLNHLNWHRKESNLKPQWGAHSQISNQYHQTNSSELFLSHYQRTILYFLFLCQWSDRCLWNIIPFVDLYHEWCEEKVKLVSTNLFRIKACYIVGENKTNSNTSKRCVQIYIF